jgi:ribosomal protein S18 acetylase RimI-like enzyme
MFSIRPMTPQDIPAGLGLCRASRWNQLARDWDQLLALNPGGARVAVIDGHVVASVVALDYARFGWVAMVLVDPAQRRQGLGTTMLTAGLELLAHVPAVRLDATPAGYPIYRARGFEEEYRLVRMERAVSDQPAPAPPVPVRRMTTADHAAIAAWDLDVFGASRRPLIEWLAAGAPGYAWVAEDAGRIAGWMLGRQGFAFDHLGPVVARDHGVAAGLVAACMRETPGVPLILDAPGDAPEWLAWLQASGFQVQRPFIRMRRGPGRITRRPEEQLAIVGPEFG